MPRPRSRIVRDCTHNGRHRHGTPLGYRMDACRCDACLDAYTRRKNRTVAARSRFGPAFVDRAEAVAHVRALIDAGMLLPAVSQRSGVPLGTIRGLLAERGPWIRRENADALLAVTDVTRRFAMLIDGTGTRRRLQALAAVGWPADRLGVLLGCSGARVRQMQGAGQVHQDTAGRVAALYDELWDRPGPSGKSRTHAARRGWPPPLLWDDDRIDDPHAGPHVAALAGPSCLACEHPSCVLLRPVVDDLVVERLTRGDPDAGRGTRHDRYEAVRQLATAGVAPSVISERLRINYDTVRAIVAAMTEGVAA